MKKILLIILLLTNSNLFAQEWDDEGSKYKHSKEIDYFSIGLYGGGHTSNSFAVSLSPVNSIAAEIEYKKSKKWGFYIKGIYEFTSKDVRELFVYTDEATLYNVINPNTFIFLFNFGGRYYLSNNNVSPYFQGGFSHEISYMGNYSYQINFGGSNSGGAKGGNYYSYFLSLDFGVGANIKLSKKFSIDMHYDVYPYIGKNSNHNGGYSALIGLKYNLF